MIEKKIIKTALLSVFDKDKIDLIALKLNSLGVKIVSTGGTQKFLEEKGIDVISVESITDFPSLFGGRVKTLHPKIMGGILSRKENEDDKKEAQENNIPEIDLVIVDLYPFEETVANTTNESEIIEKIDIGGITLIRAAAKNYKDTTIIASKDQYTPLLDILDQQENYTSLEQRRYFAAQAFNVSSHYDTSIFNYFNEEEKIDAYKLSCNKKDTLRYGENPHQNGAFLGDLNKMFNQLQGKQISYNNLLDIEAAINLISEFSETCFAILKHNNACGLACKDTVKESYLSALQGDPVSAFGGVLICNKPIDKESSEEINKLFFEVIIAPSYNQEALNILKQKKNRIILEQKNVELPKQNIRSLLNGYLVQDKDNITDNDSHLKFVTNAKPSKEEVQDMLFAQKIVKHTKSNAIVLAKDKQLLASGTGQTSRVDALKQAIEKAKDNNLSLENATMASDAFFPFADCVEIAYKEGVSKVIQPGGSIRDKDSVEFCNNHDVKMIFTGYRHFKH